MTFLDSVLLIIAAPFLYAIGVAIALFVACLVFGGLIITLEWFDKRKK